MDVSIGNRGSFGGEMAILVDPSPEFLQEAKDNGLDIRFNINNLSRVWFNVIDISKIRNRRFSQKLVDLVEIEGDFDIIYDTKYCKPVKVKQFRYVSHGKE